MWIEFSVLHVSLTTFHITNWLFNPEVFKISDLWPCQTRMSDTDKFVNHVLTILYRQWRAHSMHLSFNLRQNFNNIIYHVKNTCIWKLLTKPKGLILVISLDLFSSKIIQMLLYCCWVKVSRCECACKLKFNWSQDFHCISN